MLPHGMVAVSLEPAYSGGASRADPVRSTSAIPRRKGSALVLVLASLSFVMPSFATSGNVAGVRGALRAAVSAEVSLAGEVKPGAYGPDNATGLLLASSVAC